MEQGSELYQMLWDRAKTMLLMEFMTYPEHLTKIKADFAKFHDGEGNPIDEHKLTDACHVKLARIWLLSHGLVKTDYSVRQNMFGIN